VLQLMVVMVIITSGLQCALGVSRKSSQRTGFHLDTHMCCCFTWLPAGNLVKACWGCIQKGPDFRLWEATSQHLGMGIQKQQAVATRCDSCDQQCMGDGACVDTMQLQQHTRNDALCGRCLPCIAAF
jgi:hypothetical protein